MTKDTVIIKNDKTGKTMAIPAAHIGNYVGKGYSKTKPQTNKES